MPKRKKSIYRGFLYNKDMKGIETMDENFSKYWDHIKNNLFILGDFENKKIIFLNREFSKIAKKFIGKKVKITVEEMTGKVSGMTL